MFWALFDSRGYNILIYLFTQMRSLSVTKLFPESLNSSLNQLTTSVPHARLYELVPLKRQLYQGRAEDFRIHGALIFSAREARKRKLTSLAPHLLSLLYLVAKEIVRGVQKIHFVFLIRYIECQHLTQLLSIGATPGNFISSPKNPPLYKHAPAM